MGRAIVREPEAFLFDEPLSNLDAALRVEMRLEMARLHRRMRATTVYVTHDQVEAMTLADRIVVMNAGRVEQVGRPLDLYHRPQTLFVAGFIGSPTMNTFSVPAERRRRVSLLHGCRQGRSKFRYRQLATRTPVLPSPSGFVPRIWPYATHPTHGSRARLSSSNGSGGRPTYILILEVIGC